MAGERRGASRPSRRHEADGGGACGVLPWVYVLRTMNSGALLLQLLKRALLP